MGLVSGARRRIGLILDGLAITRYHRWYYNTGVWNTTEFLGHKCLKSVSDLWNYQEILYMLKPRLVAEFGCFNGGSTLFFEKMLGLINPDSKVFSVDASLTLVPKEIRVEPRIEFLECSSVDPKVSMRIIELRKQYAGPMFVILDSDHSKQHVLNELHLLRSVTRPGDYVIVEDGNINGHPVAPNWGPGPFEALEEYFLRYPDDYMRDERRERKFGFTFAPRGFLIRN